MRISTEIGSFAKFIGEERAVELVAQAGFDCYVGSCYEDLLFYESARIDVEKDEYEFTLFQGENDK